MWGRVAEGAVSRATTPAQLFAQARAFIQEVIRGKDDVVELVLVAYAAGGHVLLEDVPGVGKTTLARAMAQAVGGQFARIQFTSDLLPGDITGVNVLTQTDGADPQFRFRAGPIFANVVVADELNRGTPKTQSALLECMSEGQVSVDGRQHPLPSPFTVIATQNPFDHHGTFPLPDSQLDRFLLRVSMGYPDAESEREVLRAGAARGWSVAQAKNALNMDEVATLTSAVRAVRIHPDVEDYILSLVRRTRSDSRLVRGVSTRGAEALCRACQALAVSRDRDFVIPEDVFELAVPTLAHRVEARLAQDPGGADARRAIEGILAEIRPHA